MHKGTKSWHIVVGQAVDALMVVGALAIVLVVVAGCGLRIGAEPEVAPPVKCIPCELKSLSPPLETSPGPQTSRPNWTKRVGW